MRGFVFLVALLAVGVIGCNSTTTAGAPDTAAMDAFASTDASTTTDTWSDAASVTDAGSDTGTDTGASANDAGYDAGSDAGTSTTACPASAPTGTCASNGLQCSYGNDPRVACRTLATCNAGQWSVTTPTCTAAPTCPASEPNGNACSDHGAECGYGTNACTCYACSIPCSLPTTWHCSALAAACPSSAPNLGTPCTGTTVCNYGACTGSWAVACQGGTWVRHSMICPG